MGNLKISKDKSPKNKKVTFAEENQQKKIIHNWNENDDFEGSDNDDDV